MHNVPGIETADYEIAKSTTTPASLTDLFKGASVVLQHRRPFSELGPAAVEAAWPQVRTTPTRPVSRTG